MHSKRVPSLVRTEVFATAEVSRARGRAARQELLTGSAAIPLRHGGGGADLGAGRFPLLRFRGEVAEAHLLVLLGRIEGLLLLEPGIDGQVVDDRLAFVHRAAVYGGVEVVRPVGIHRTEIAV